MIMADNPWAGYKYWNGDARYERSPVPWDKRKQGKEALSDDQTKVVNKFIKVAGKTGEGEKWGCNEKTGVPRNVCRVGHVKEQMEGIEAEELGTSATKFTTPP